jgi:hypothetical protein
MPLLRQALLAERDAIRDAVKALVPRGLGQPVKVALGTVTGREEYVANRRPGIRLLLKEVLEQAGFAVAASAEEQAPVMVSLRYLFVVEAGAAPGDGAADPATTPNAVFQEMVVDLDIGNRDGQTKQLSFTIRRRDVEPFRWQAFVDYMLGWRSPAPSARTQAAVDTAPKPESTPASTELPRYQVAIQVKQGDRYVARPLTPQVGHDFIRLDLGEVFAIELTNNDDYHAVVRLTIDGVNVFEFSDYRETYYFYVVPRHSRLLVKGWHRNNEVSDEFLIGTYPESVNARVIRQPDKVGTITAEFAAAWTDRGKRPPDEQTTRDASPPAQAVHQGEQVKSVFRVASVYHSQSWKQFSICYPRDGKHAPQVDKPPVAKHKVVEPQPAKPEPQPKVPPQDAILATGWTPPNRRWAVLIAASNYEHLVGFPSRHQNIMALKECLLQCGVPEAHILVLSDGLPDKQCWPTKANIEHQLQWLQGRPPQTDGVHLKNVLGPEDEVLVAMALYGVTDHHGAGTEAASDDNSFLCPLDSTVRKQRGSSLAADSQNLLPVAAVRQAMMACKAERKVLVLDVFRGDPRPGTRSVTPEESVDLRQLRPHRGYAELIGYDDRDVEVQYVGAFLNTVLFGLQGHADLDGNRVVTSHELGEYVERFGDVSSRRSAGTKLVGQDYPVAKVEAGRQITVTAANETLLRVGAALCRHGLVDDGIEAFDRALKDARRKELQNAIYAARAQAFLALGRDAEAEADFRRRVEGPFVLKTTRPGKVLRGSEPVADLKAGASVEVTEFRQDFVGVSVKDDQNQVVAGWLPKAAFRPPSQTERTTGAKSGSKRPLSRVRRG